MKFVIKIGFIRGTYGYAYSVWIETEYEAIIDMWSEYIGENKLKDIFFLIIKELFSKINRIAREDSDLLIYVDNSEFKEFIDKLLEEGVDNLYIKLFKTRPNNSFTVNVKAVKFDKEGRIYSLAKMALNSKGRYPPIL